MVCTKNLPSEVIYALSFLLLLAKPNCSLEQQLQCSLVNCLRRAEGRKKPNKRWTSFRIRIRTVEDLRGSPQRRIEQQFFDDVRGWLEDGYDVGQSSHQRGPGRGASWGRGRPSPRGREGATSRPRVRQQVRLPILEEALLIQTSIQTRKGR